MKRNQRGTLIITLVCILCFFVGAMGVSAATEQEYTENAATLEALDAKLLTLLDEIETLQDTLPPDSPMRDWQFSLLGKNYALDTACDIMVNGIGVDIVLVKADYFGISNLYQKLFKSYTYEYSKNEGSLFKPNWYRANVYFEQGLLNGPTKYSNNVSPSVAINGVAGQSLEAKVAAQEVLLYIGESVEAMMVAIKAAYSGGIDDPAQLLSELQVLLDFNDTALQNLDDVVKSSLQNYSNMPIVATNSKNETKNYSIGINLTGSDGLYTKSLTGISDGQVESFALLATVRDVLFNYMGITDQVVQDLGTVLTFIGGALDGSLFERYETIDFSDVNDGLDKLLQYLDEDLGSIKTVINTAQSIAGPIGKLLGIEDPDAIALISELLGGEFQLGKLLGEYVDQAIAASDYGAYLSDLGIGAMVADLFAFADDMTTEKLLTEITRIQEILAEARVALADMDLNALIQFVQDVASGDALNKYQGLTFTTTKDIGRLLQYVQSDLGNVQSILKAADFFDLSIGKLLGIERLSDVLVEFAHKSLPTVIDKLLNEQWPGSGDQGIGDFVAELMAPLKELTLPQMISYLDAASDILTQLTGYYNWLDNMLTFDENEQINGVNIWAVLDNFGITRDDIKAMVNGAINDGFQAALDAVDTILKGDLGNIDATKQTLENLKAALAGIRDEVLTLDNMIDQFKAVYQELVQLHGDVGAWLTQDNLNALAAAIFDHYKPLVAQAIRDAIANSNIPALVDKLGEIRGDIQQTIGQIKDAIGKVNTAIGNLERIYEEAKNWLTDENMQALLQAIYDRYKPVLEQALKDFIDQPDVAQLIEKINGICTEINGYAAQIKEIAAEVAKYVEAAKEILGNEQVQAILNQLLTTLATELGNAIQEYIDQIKEQPIETTLKQIYDDVKALVAFFEAGCDLRITATSVEQNGVYYRFSTNYDPIIARVQPLLEKLGMYTRFQINHGGDGFVFVNNDLKNSNATIGVYTIEVSFRFGLNVGFGQSFDATLGTKEVTANVKPKALQVSTLPQTSYFAGERLNLGGLGVNLLYTAGEQIVLPSTAYTTDPANDVVLSEVHASVTIAYTEDPAITTSFNLTVKPVTERSLEVTQLPDKTSYTAGQALDLTGLIVSVRYNDNHVVPLREGDYVASPGHGSALQAANNKVTLTYDGLDTSFPITVASPQITPNKPDEPGPAKPNALKHWQLMSEESGALPYYLDQDQKKVFVPLSYVIAGKMHFLAEDGREYFFANNPKSYTDIAGHWGYDKIMFIAEREVFLGTGNGEFSPDQSMTRAMFVTVLARMVLADTSSYTRAVFSDVEPDAWYGPSVAWASDHGITQGIGYGLFGPDQLITREQMATMIQSFMAYLEMDLDKKAVTMFEDENLCQVWFKSAVSYVRATGIMLGYEDGSFRPQNLMTRAECATALERITGMVMGQVVAKAEQE